MKKTEKIEVRIPSDLKTAFKARCEAAGMTASEVLRAYAEGQLSEALPAAPAGPPRIARPTVGASSVMAAAAAASKRAATALAILLAAALSVVFLAMAILKPLWRDHVGLFRMADGSLSGGIISDASGASELLGLWTMPIALALAGLLLLSLAKLTRKGSPRPAAAQA